MAEREQPSEELGEFERHLSALTPRPLTLDRAVLLFQAGKEASRTDRRRWRNRQRCWQAVAAAMTLLALGASWHAWQDQPQVVQRIRYLPAPAVVDELPHDSSSVVRSQNRNRNHYLHQRYVALTVGLDGLDGLDVPAAFGSFDKFDNRTYRDLMDQYYEFP
ncbi:MAG: hypothetical protein QGF59_29905 [Pirellulaceae bacterium]|jgi:hypothetical protein|nr:hypothetical protein [Pirellulaceae bacterium]MDP6722916.1 hypothetical protein [Pirellulaceae bacterium]